MLLLLIFLIIIKITLNKIIYIYLYFFVFSVWTPLIFHKLYTYIILCLIYNINYSFKEFIYIYISYITDVEEDTGINNKQKDSHIHGIPENI